MRLQKAFLLSAGILAGLGVVLATALIVITSSLHRAAWEIGEAVESVHAAHELGKKVTAYSHERLRRRHETDLNDARDQIRYWLAEVEKHFGSPEEAEKAGQIKEQLNLLLEASPESPSLRSLGAPLDAVFKPFRRGRLSATPYRGRTRPVGRTEDHPRSRGKHHRGKRTRQRLHVLGGAAPGTGGRQPGAPRARPPV